LKGSALVSIAGALAATDPDRAARLIADVELIGRSITRNHLKGNVLVSIAGRWQLPTRIAELLFTIGFR